MSESLNNIRLRIEALGIDFQFIKPIQTGAKGEERDTWLLEYEGSQFIFVPGQKNVTLGWDVEKCPLGSGLLEGLKEEFAAGCHYYKEELKDYRKYYEEQIEKAQQKGELEKADELRQEMAEELEMMEEDIEEKGYTSWENFMEKWNQNLSQCLSPLRTADIGDMLVEVDSRYLEEDVPSLEQAILSLKKGPFTLATEDEYEYLCNGGARTLFRWGDTLEDVMEEIFNVGSVSNPMERKILEQPNALGLFMAYNSYKNEIIDNTAYTKGGDGGCSLCGGDGAIYVLPCYTAFYRNPMCEIYERPYGLSKNYFCYRRIVRLP